VYCSLDSSQTSVQDDPSDDQLINLDAPASKFDQMTLDDLNDDDFDPRAGDQTGGWAGPFLKTYFFCFFCQFYICGVRCYFLFESVL
jgi:hypothetical protein